MKDETDANSHISRLMEAIPRFLKFSSAPRLVAMSLALFSLLFILPPLRPLEGAVRPANQMAAIRAKRSREILNVTLLLKANGALLDHAALQRIAKTIVEESEKYSLDPLLVLAIMKVESRFRAKVVSADGARGLMQIRPSVAHALSEKLEIKVRAGKKSLDDPVTNVKLGIFYLAQLKRQFTDLRHALAAYNYGPSRVRARLERKRPISLAYPRKVMVVYRAYRDQNRETS